MKIWTYKSASKLIPATTEDKEKIGKLPVGEPIQISYTRSRNPQFHRKFFALLQFAWTHLPEKYEPYFPTSKNVPDEFREEVVKRAGYYTEWTNFKGVKEYKAKSISFSSMDQDEFEELYSACIDVIIKYLELTRETIENELMEFMG